MALMKCKVVIPNDHIFDEINIGHDAGKCGRSVYNAVPRWPSAKSGHRCTLDKVRMKHLLSHGPFAAHAKLSHNSKTSRANPVP